VIDPIWQRKFVGLHKPKFNNMKRILLLSLLTALTIQLNAQSASKEKEQSNAEIFSAKSGALMQKEFIDLDKIKSCEIQVLHFTDLITSSKQSGLKFSMDVASSYSTDTKSAMLDADEIDGLMKSIKLIQDKVLVTTPATYTEVYYRSRSGFEAGCYTSKGSWSCYIKLEKFDSKSYVWINAEELTKLYSILEQAKLKM
jgi:hypothetical protein